MRLAVVLALARADTRRMAGRLVVGLVPTAVIAGASAVSSGSISRALLLASLFFVAVGALFGPMQLVHDRRTGVLDYLRGLPLSQVELAISRLVVFGVLAVAGAVGCGFTILGAAAFGGPAITATMLAPAVSALAMGMFLVAGLASPFFARMSPPLAVGLPVVLLLLIAKGLGPARLKQWGAVIASAAQAGELPIALPILAAWLTIAVLMTAVIVLLGRALQARKRPTGVVHTQVATLLLHDGGNEE